MGWDGRSQALSSLCFWIRRVAQQHSANHITCRLVALAFLHSNTCIVWLFEIHVGVVGWRILAVRWPFQICSTKMRWHETCLMKPLSCSGLGALPFSISPFTFAAQLICIYSPCDQTLKMFPRRDWKSRERMHKTIEECSKKQQRRLTVTLRLLPERARARRRSTKICQNMMDTPW